MITHTDRELLELAAKAARHYGANIIDSVAGPQIFVRHDSNGDECYHIWNPADDDGEALRLAVVLGLSIHQGAGYTSASCPHIQKTERHRGEAGSATRRAIVRAAAEIGMGL